MTFSFPTVDFPPTGTDRIEYDMQYSGGQTLSEEELIFNTKDYISFDQRNSNIIIEEYFRNLGRRSDRLLLGLKTQFENKEPNFFNTTSKKELQKTAGLTSVFILMTNPTKVSVEITPDATVFFTVVYKNINAYLEIHSSLGEDTELVFNIYEHSIPILAYGGHIEVALNQYLQFISKRLK